MARIYRYSLLTLSVLALISMPLSTLVQPASAAPPPNCMDSVHVYTVEVCISTPAGGSTLTGNTTITGTVSVIGTNPGVNQMTFFLTGTDLVQHYLLSEFHSPYTFTLPTNKFVDGTYTLSAEALMLDGFTTSQASISLTFNTGTTTPPVVGNTFTPTSGTTPPAGQPLVVAVVGDGADGSPANLSVAGLIASMHPNLFLYLGDVYDEGTYTEFVNWYGAASNFGQFKSITDPTVGSHEYLTGTDSGYQLYWDTNKDYYSFNAGGWHFISLNSNTSQIPGNGTITSPEYLFLQSDLTANPNPCTIVFYHHPFFSIGLEGTNHLMRPIWQLLANHRVTMVLNGNDHDYERWLPLDANGNINVLGTTEFVVGTGGHAIQSFPTPITENRVAAKSDAFPLTYGALKLSLFAGHANYAFMSTSGSTIDSGSLQCHSTTDILSTIYLPFIAR